MWCVWVLACVVAEREKGGAGDDGCSVAWYYDGDGDGVGVAGAVIEACDGPIGYVAAAGDCDDTRADVAPGAAESCDQVDQDCDGVVDEDAVDDQLWLADEDGDTYGATAAGTVRACEAPTGFVATGAEEDCDDDDATDHPGAPERCDGRDNDCDGVTDEDPEGSGVTYYADVDGDGYGDPAATTLACAPPGAGWSDVSGDCDDLLFEVHPGADELCNDADDDCDGSTDELAVDMSTWYVDFDEDGYGGTDVTTEGCAAPADFVANADDCDNLRADVNPGASERCDGDTDEDCDGEVDEGSASDAETWYRDGDDDGFGDPDAAQAACAQPTDHVADGTDCDDTDATVSPSGTEVCDGMVDEDCDGSVDEASAIDAVDHYADADADGFGDAATSTHSCLPAGRVVVAEDCDDTDAAVSPDASEVCGDAVDDDCDGEAQGCFLGPLTDTDADVEIAGGSSSTGFGRDAVAGDLTGDGQDDLLVADMTSTPSLRLYEGPVAGGTSGSSIATFDMWNTSCCAGTARPQAWADHDFDGDGQTDLAMWYTTGGAEGLAIGRGPFDATSTNASLYRRLVAGTNGMLDGDVGDVDGDGASDVLVSTYDYGVVGYPIVGGAYYLGSTTAGDAGSGYSWRISGRFYQVATGGDFDGDGLDDVAAISDGAFGRIWIFDAISAAMTTADAAASIGVPDLVAGIEILGDVDGDGYDDLFWARQGSSVVGYLMTDPLSGGESYLPGVVAASYSPSESQYVLRPSSVDLDGDGMDELLLGAYDDADAQAWVFYGPHSGTYVPETDADVVVLDPDTSSTAHRYVSVLPVGDVLGTGNASVFFGSTANTGSAWLFDVAP